MRILYVSDYAPWNKIANKEMPSHHLFGVHELIDHYERKANGLCGILKENVCGGGQVDFFKVRESKLPNIINQIIIAKDIWILSKRYDCIYIAIGHCAKLVGTLRKLGIIKSKIVAVLHHPPFWQLHIGKYDAAIFFDEQLKELAASIYPSMSNKFFVNEWGPDVQWYKDVIKENYATESRGDFIDNGKTDRDSSLFISASNKLSICCYSYYDALNNQSNKIIENDIESVNRVNSYRCVAIPIIKERGRCCVVCGLTSFMDAIALKKPCVVSDNVFFAKQVMDYNLGYVYKAGDKASLCLALQYLRDDIEYYKTCVAALESYQKEINIENYSKNLLFILQNL